MEARDVPSASPDNLIAIPYYGGSTDATVELLNAATDIARIPLITPFVGYHGPIVAATGDVNHDGVSDVIVGAQAPNGHVKVFNGANGALMQSFLSFAGFDGAVNVGAADINGDHYADILVTASAINGHVKAFSGANDSLLSSFFAFPGFLGQTSVSGADFNHDGVAEILVGAGGVGVGGRVALFNANGTYYNPGFLAFPGYDGSINVAAGDVNGDGHPDIVVAAGPGVPGGHVEAFSGVGFGAITSFIPYGPTVTGGIDVRLGDANLDGRTDILVFVSGGGYPSLTAFDGLRGGFAYRGTGGQGTYSSPDPNDYGGNFGGDNSYTPPPDTSYTPPDTSYTPPDFSYTPPDDSYTPPDDSYTPDYSYSPPDYSYDNSYTYDSGSYSYDPGNYYDYGE